MKKIITIYAAILMTANVWAQSPEKMSYQAIIRNSSNDLIINQSIGMRISILHGTSNGNSVYVETQTPSTNANGLVSIEIGSGTTVSGIMDTIDWVNGPYFIKTETDPSGGTSYTITGTSQLLSVPYALHAKTAESVSGTITEADPIFGGSVAKGITVLDTINWNFDNDPTNELQQFSVSHSGDTLHLQKGGFVIIPGISAANPSYPPGTIHCSSTPTAIVDVINPTTGKTWMDRNLGASQVSTSISDTNSYGDLYQWGRRSDGHQCRNSPTTTSLSSSDKPLHGSFILVQNSPLDWRSPQNTNLWQGVNGVNNPCPSGYRLPTEAELDNERQSWTQNNSTGAFASPLKIPLSGVRLTSGLLRDMGTLGYYWSSNTSSSNSRGLTLSSGNAFITFYNRAVGRSVRCIKD